MADSPGEAISRDRGWPTPHHHAWTRWTGWTEGSIMPDVTFHPLTGHTTATPSGSINLTTHTMFTARLTFLPLILFAPLLYGCEGTRCASGVVVDAVTLAPLDSVLCIETTLPDTAVTDQDGRYAVCGQFSGCVPDCPDISVEFSRTGYVTATYINPETDSIFLEPQ